MRRVMYLALLDTGEGRLELYRDPRMGVGIMFYLPSELFRRLEEIGLTDYTDIGQDPQAYVALAGRGVPELLADLDWGTISAWRGPSGAGTHSIILELPQEQAGRLMLRMLARMEQEPS